jgi:hypothetical protein
MLVWLLMRIKNLLKITKMQAYYITEFIAALKSSKGEHSSLFWFILSEEWKFNDIVTRFCSML